VYKDWDDFLNNNQLPKCTYCYPRRGVYDGDKNDKVYLDFGKTPAAKPGGILCSALDTASTVVMVSFAAFVCVHVCVCVHAHVHVCVYLLHLIQPVQL
jgi:hypothetical protein